MASEVKERLLEYLHYKRISQVEFTRMLGVSSTYVGAMRRSLSDDKIMKVRRLFPDLNTDWLLYGQGDMLLESVVKAAADADELAAHGVRMVPLLPAAAYAGNIEAYSEGVVPEDCELIATQIRSAEMAVRVSGDSMEPKFHDGMVLFIRRINDRSFIPWGYPLVVDTDNGVVLKCLYPTVDDDARSEARSLNPAYPPFSISTDTIFGLYRVLGALSVYSTI